MLDNSTKKNNPNAGVKNAKNIPNLPLCPQSLERQTRRRGPSLPSCSPPRSPCLQLMEKVPKFKTDYVFNLAYLWSVANPLSSRLPYFGFA